jgi:hypothetical protein
LNISAPRTSGFYNTVMAPGTFFDPSGKYEPQDTLYKLTVHKPSRPLPIYLPAIFTYTPVTHPIPGSIHTIKPDNYGSNTPNYNEFSEKDLKNMPTTTVKVKAWQFPVKMQCAQGLSSYQRIGYHRQ